MSSPPVFSGVCVTHSVVICAVFCLPSFVFRCFFYLLVIVLSVLFFNSRFLVSALTPSNSSYYHWVDFNAGGHYVSEHIIRTVLFKWRMNLGKWCRTMYT